MKSEPDVYGIDHLQQEHSTLWDGIRNYQARNFMRTMAIGDQAFFYHSNCKPPGIIGLMEVTETGLIDPTQFDPSSKYQRLLSLDELRQAYQPEELAVVKRGNRLSILPVDEPIAHDLLKRLGPLQ